MATSVVLWLALGGVWDVCEVQPPNVWGVCEVRPEVVAAASERKKVAPAAKKTVAKQSNTLRPLDRIRVFRRW